MSDVNNIIDNEKEDTNENKSLVVELDLTCPNCKEGKLKEIESKKNGKKYIICGSDDCEFIQEKGELIDGVKCPTSGGEIFENEKIFYCLDSGLTIWKNIAGHKLTIEELEILLNGGETEKLSDLYSKKKDKYFEAKLHYNIPEDKIDFIFD